MWLIGWKEYRVAKRAFNGPTLPNPLIYFNGPARYWPNPLLTLLNNTIYFIQWVPNPLPTSTLHLLSQPNFLFFVKYEA